MLNTREILEARETQILAPYAQHSADSAGRAHAEVPHPYRTEFQRDRARIVHSKAFRRLEYKTQVFLNGSGDHLRTRLTHTIEVASLSRAIAGALGLNEDLAEAIALAHDLGHPPFGHSGEEALQCLMREHGGFEHNRQSLRIVETLEKKYPQFHGLNLSFEVREGLQKHRKFYAAPPLTANAPYPSPSLEAQVANLADEITYYSHDLDDGLDAGLIAPEQLDTLDVWRTSNKAARRRFPDLKGHELSIYVIRCIIDREVEDVVAASAERIRKSGVDSVEKVRRCEQPLIRYSDALLAANRQLRKWLFANLYFHPQVHAMNERACRMLESVFGAYLENPEWMGDDASQKIERNGLHRVVCDYLSGMTDRYLLGEYERLFGNTRDGG